MVADTVVHSAEVKAWQREVDSTSSVPSADNSTPMSYLLACKHTSRSKTTGSCYSRRRNTSIHRLEERQPLASLSTTAFSPILSFYRPPLWHAPVHAKEMPQRRTP
ncbi:unnamed protein product [Ectocarpus sp. 6 AP-2014]